MSYGQPITIDLTERGEVLYKFPPCNRLWLAKSLCLADQIVINPTDAVLGIKIGEKFSQMLPWAIADGYVNSASGTMTQIWVTVLTKGASDAVYLSTGTDVGIGYGSTDGLSPQVDSGSASGDSFTRGRSGGGGGGSN